MKLNKNEKQIILFKLKKLKKDTININKQIEDFSIRYNNFNDYKKNENINILEEDDTVNFTVIDLNKKYKNIIYIIKSFIIKYPKLFELKEKYLNHKSFIKENKKINKASTITNIKNKNIKREDDINKKNILSERNLKTNKDYFLDNIERRIKINKLKDKIKNIQINFDKAQFNTNELSYNFFDKNFITPSNKNEHGLKNNSFIKNESSKSNMLNNMNILNSRERLLNISRKKSFQKENGNIISNQNFHINKSCKSSSINLNIINDNQENMNNLSNISKFSKIIPNNYPNSKKKINSIKNYIKLNTNPNNQDLKIKEIKSTKNNKTFNFSIKNILFDQKNQKKIIFKKLKTNMVLKDNTPKCYKPIQTNNKILYSKPLNYSKRSKSEYLLKSIKNNNIFLNLNNENYLRGFSLDNLSFNKIKKQNKNINIIIKKSKPKIRNRTINIFNDNLNEEFDGVINKNKSFSMAYKKLSNNNNLNNKVIDNNIIMKTQYENKELKNEINHLKKEIENFKYIFKKLSSRVCKLEEENKILKKQNDEIIKLLIMNNKI